MLKECKFRSNESIPIGPSRTNRDGRDLKISPSQIISKSDDHEVYLSAPGSSCLGDTFLSSQLIT